MSQDKLDQQQEQRNSGRRSRKDQQGRDYVCGCGKSYLSYPALYTHIKTKHEGLRPEGTCKVNNVNPKKSTASHNSHANVIQTNQNQDAFIVYKAAPHTNPLHVSHQTHQKPAPSKKIKSILNQALLSRIQHSTTAADYNLSYQLHIIQTNQSTSTPPNNRIIKQKVGEEIYEKYMDLIKLGKDIQADLGISNENNTEDQDQNIDQLVELVEQRLEKLGPKCQIEYMMVIYLLGAGRYVGQKYMQLYMQFTRLFRDCFVDHAQDIYQACFKQNQHIQTKYQNLRQYRQFRERDNPYKYYEYSYLPSSSKSKSYQSYQQSQQQQSSHSTINHTNIISSINNRQCKYCPIICQFFAKVYIPTTDNKNQLYQQIMELLCIDFCGWLWKNKYTVVDVSLMRKYQLKANVDGENMEKKIARQHSSSKKRQKIVQVTRKPNNTNTNVNTNLTTSSADKTKKNKIQQSQQMLSQGQQINQQQQQHEQQNENHLNVNDHQHSQPQNYHSHSQQRHHHDQDSYKLGPEIAIGVRDRSGSIQQFINITQQNQQQQQQPIIANQNQAQHQHQHADEQNSNEAAVPRIIINGQRRAQNNEQGNPQHNIDQQQIQKYINT